MINAQKISSEIYYDKIPISNKLKFFLSKNSLKKSKFIFNGDDYQILFTARPSKARIIKNIAKSLGVKISKIGKICSASTKPEILDQKGMKIKLKTKGYIHKF